MLRVLPEDCFLGKNAPYSATADQPVQNSVIAVEQELVTHSPCIAELGHCLAARSVVSRERSEKKWLALCK